MSTRQLLFQLFKYAVYAALILNTWLFFSDEHAAAPIQFPNGLTVSLWREAYAATIDTAAWVVLLLMFELETAVYEDHNFTKPVELTLHGIRVGCYLFIGLAFWGYVENLVSAYDVASIARVESLCALVADNWSYAVTLDEFTTLTAENCAELASGSALWQFGDLAAVVDQQGLETIQGLAWVDVVNAAVWILVVILLEADVRLQERGLLAGRILKLSSAAKVVLYSTLFLCATYWWIDGDFLDFWDAFLWLVAFFFIELNVVEWRKEDELADAARKTAPG